MFKKTVLTLVFVAIAALTGNAPADLVSFTLELNSGGSPKIVIDNRSAARWSLGSVVFDFSGSSVVLDTTAGDGIGTDPVDHALAFSPAGTYGSFNTVVSSAGLACYAHTGNLAGLTSDINTTGIPGRTMTFNFIGSGILTGHGWGFNVDWDKTGTNNSPRGGDINGTIVTAYFLDNTNPLNTFTLAHTYSNVAGNGQSFPAQAFGDAIPEPAGAGGMIAVAVWALFFRRRVRQHRA
jgi:hypothetical protein